MATTRATELGQLAKLVTVDSNGNSVIAGTFDATLPASGVVAGVHGSASAIPIMSVTAQGLIDSVGSADIVTASSLSFDSATGQLTLGFSDTSTISQTLTLDPFTTDDLTEGSNLYYSDARFDSAFGVKTTADLTEGSNLYYTDVRFDSAFGDKSTTNLTEGDNLYYTQGRFDSALGDKTTDNLTEGSNLYYTTARADSDAKAAISVTDAGGDGSLTYSAGAITYTGPSASEVRSHFSGGTGVDISSGVVSIGQNVDSSSNVIFQTVETTGNVTIGGNLQVNGATTTVSSQNLSIEDNMLYLNQLESDGSPTIEVDVGFAANVNDTGTYAHTGFFRDATDATWKLFDGYTPEPDSDLDIDINHASFEYAKLHTGNLTVDGPVEFITDSSSGGYKNTFSNTGTGGRDYYIMSTSNSNGSMGGGKFMIGDDDVIGNNAAQARLTIDNAGNIGVGTSAPTAKFDIRGDTLQLLNSANNNNTFLIAENSGAGNAGLQIKNQDGTWNFIANDRLRIIDGDASLERMSILSNGNVGIGTTSPNYKLQVNGNLDILNLQGSSGNAFIRFTDGDASADWSVGSDDGSGGGAGSFIVYDRNNTAYRLAIKSNGYVGIDTANPGEKLQVDAGNIHVGGVTSSTALTSGSQYKIKMGQQYWSGTKGTDASIKLELYSLSSSDTYGLGISTSELEIQSQQDIGFYAGGSSTRTKRMHIEGTNGNVGIGSTSPSNQLEVTGGTNKAVISVTNADLGSLHYTDRNGRYLTSNGSGWTSGVDGADPGIVIGSDNSSGQIKGVGIVLHNDNNSDNQYSPTISFGNKSNSGSYNTTYAHIIGRKTGQAADANWSAGELGFYTQPVGGYVTNATQLIIKSDGKVGIGENSPAEKLHVNGNIRAEDGEIHLGDVSADNWTRIKHATADGYGFDWQHDNATVIVNEQGSTNEALVLGDVDANNSYSGLFGIAHSTDTGSTWTKKLDLRGNGDLYIGPSGTTKVLTTETFDEIATLTSPASSSGTWTNADADDWGTPRIGTSLARYNDGTGYLQFNIPSGMDTAYISQLQWSSGGYADIYGVQSDGGLVFLRRINTLQSVENSNEGAGGGNNNQHDGSTITLAATGLSTFSAIRLQNRSGRFHLTGLGFTASKLHGAEGTGMVHPQQFSTTTGLNADTLDGYHGNNYIGKNGNAYYRPDNWIDFRGGQGIYWGGGTGSGWHLYPVNSEDFYIRSGSAGASTLRFTCDNTTARGYVYANSSNQIGFLDADRNWAYKHTRDNKHEFYVNDTLYSTLNTDFFEHTSDIRAPIFYENSNTAYYFDGANSGDSIRVAGDIVAYYSDERLKDKEGNISGAIDKVSKLNGFYYRANKKAQELGYDTRLQVGVSAQEVEAVLPEVVKDAPIGQGYKTVKYDRMVPLLIEAIKEQQEIINKQSQDIDELKQLVKQLMENK